VRSQYKIFTLLRGLLRKTKSTGSNTATFYGQLDQRSEAINGLSEVHRLGVEIDFFDFGVGSHHGELVPEGIRSPASCII
jgi:hypothetical protein